MKNSVETKTEPLPHLPDEKDKQFIAIAGKVLDLWFEPKSFEPGLYKKLGVEKLQKIIPTTGDAIVKKFWDPLFRHIPYFQNIGFGFANRLPERELKEIELAYKALEAIHVAGAIAFCLIACQQFEDGYIGSATLNMLLNVPLNIYPVMLQRVHRMKLEKISNLYIQRRKNKDMANKTSEVKES